MGNNKYDMEDDNVILAPLDVNNFIGLAEGRLSPWLKCLGLGLGPLIFAPYLLQFIKLSIVIIVFLLWFLFVLAHTVGDQKNRLKRYKKRLAEENVTAFELLNIKRIWNTGCIEYLNSQVAYVIVCENSDRGSVQEKSAGLTFFYTSLLSKYKVDLYFQNVDSCAELDKRYAMAKALKDRNVRNDYVENIDYNINLILSKSRLMRPVFIIRGRRGDFKDILKTAEEVTRSNAARVFKSVTVLKDEEAINNIISRDMDTYVNYQELIMQKYCTKEYYKSKVIGYDIQDDNLVIADKNDVKNIRGFMVNE